MEQYTSGGSMEIKWYNTYIILRKVTGIYRYTVNSQYMIPISSVRNFVWLCVRGTQKRLLNQMSILSLCNRKLGLAAKGWCRSFRMPGSQIFPSFNLAFVPLLPKMAPTPPSLTTTFQKRSKKKWQRALCSSASSFISLNQENPRTTRSLPRRLQVIPFLLELNHMAIKKAAKSNFITGHTATHKKICHHC